MSRILRRQSVPASSCSLPCRSFLSGFLTLTLSLLPLAPLASAQVLDPNLFANRPKPVHGTVSISRDVNISPGNDKVSLNLRDASLRDVLNTLAEQGHFNLILDPSVQGNLTVDIKDIPINKALEYLFTVSQLSYYKDGNTVIVASREQANEKNLNAKILKAIPVLYKDAGRIAGLLNNTVFKVPRPNGSTTALASFDADSNSLLVMGTESDIKLVTDTLHEVDIPRNRKVYSIRHNTPSYVASVLAANFFQSGSGNGSNGSTGGNNNGNNQFGGSNGAMGGANGSMNAFGGGATGSGASGGMAGGAMGNGGMNGGGVNGGMSGSNGANGANGANGNMASTMGTFTVNGVTFISEPVSATLTVLGTDEQLALIDSIIDQVDVRRPQAEIEVSLVEIQNSELKNLKPLWGQIFLGKETSLTLNQLDDDGNPTGVNVFNYIKDNVTGQNHRSPVSTFKLSQNHQSVKGKVLANPTIVAMDGLTSTITITDQIPNISQSITQSNGGPPVVTTTINTQDAGITMSMTPTISNDGSVVLNLQPEVSQPSRVVSSGAVSTTLISRRSLSLAGVRVKDGQTLVIGGLLRESERMDVSRVPGLDKLPIVSAMFRTINSNDKDKTELVLMVTPHILREDAVTYFTSGSGTSSKSSQVSSGSMNRTAGFQPVSLPRFMGPKQDPAIPLRPADSSSP